nr:MAG TPA: hypothetical protein [Caudoviricetes sp.]
MVPQAVLTIKFLFNLPEPHDRGFSTPIYPLRA